MKRFLLLVVLVGVAVLVAGERVPWLRERMPWLPHVPWLQTAATSGDAASPDGAKRQGRGGGAEGGRRRGGGGPIPVLVAEARYDDLPVTVDVLGTVQATNTVTVRSQVDGKLIEVDFREGQDVKAGDVLARIDPATFQAAYDQAVAKKAQDESILANAQADLGRYVKLAATQYGSAQQADTQRALVTQTQAIILQDTAQVESAKTTLDYATIRSPITGRTGLRLVDAGNIVHAADTTGIVTVTQVHPIAVVFNLPQQYLRQVNAAQAAAPLKAQAIDGDGRSVIDTGTLEVIDNTVDQTTGTVKLKGTFPNPSSLLWPGQFVNVRLFIDTLRHVVTVPTTAVQRGPDGAFVYAVSAADTASMRKVTVGRQTEDTSVITAGLEVPTTVVTTGFTRLTDGAKVSVSSATASAATSDAPASAGEVRGGTAPETAKHPGGEAASGQAGSGQTAGLQPEDMVVQVNGQPTPDLTTFKTTFGDFRKAHAHDPIVMVVKREGREQTIRIEPPQ